MLLFFRVVIVVLMVECQYQRYRDGPGLGSSLTPDLYGMNATRNNRYGAVDLSPNISTASLGLPAFQARSMKIVINGVPFPDVSSRAASGSGQYYLHGEYWESGVLSRVSQHTSQAQAEAMNDRVGTQRIPVLDVMRNPWVRLILRDINLFRQESFDDLIRPWRLFSGA